MVESKERTNKSKDLSQKVLSVIIINPPNGFIARDSKGQEYCIHCNSYAVARAGEVEMCYDCNAHHG